MRFKLVQQSCDTVIHRVFTYHGLVSSKIGLVLIKLLILFLNFLGFFLFENLGLDQGFVLICLVRRRYNYLQESKFPKSFV